MKTKTVAQSAVIIGNQMQPAHANPSGTVHGGEIMKLMDHAAGIVTMRHARASVVTARVDCLEFHQPIHVGNLVTCEAHLTFVGRSSMETSVTVWVEDLTKEGEAKVALTSLFTMVAMDKDGNPVAVPPLALVSDEERASFAAGRQRYLDYKNKRGAH